jgi:hypothetical protein
MSLKNKFSNKTTKNLSSKDIDIQVESKDFTKEKLKDIYRVIPNVDFSDANNFAKFGSARKYYIDSISRIYKTYPYDGSFKEISQWKNESSYLDVYLFDNVCVASK